MKAMERETGGCGAPAGRYAISLGVLLLCAAVCLAQMLPTASSDKVVVEDVIPEGNHKMTSQQIIGLIHTRPGKELKNETVEQDIIELKKTQQFRDIRVVYRDGTLDPKKKIVIFQLQEYPNKVQEIKYIGAKHLKPDELDQLTGLHKGGLLNPVANQQAAHAILAKYYEEGRPLANVNLVEGGRMGDSRVIFNITEGPKVKIRDIHFTGAHFVSDARLNTQVSSTPEFLRLIGGKYNPQLVEQDRISLETYYRSFGFHDVRVAQEVIWEPDMRYVHIIFHIQEGQRYKIKSVNVEGVASVPREEMIRLVQLKPGEYYDERTIKKDESHFTDKLGYQGRQVAVKPELTWDETQSGTVNVDYKIEEQPPAKVGQIIIVGNTVTKQNVILRAVPLYPGQTLTYPDLRVAEQNLARLGIFENKPEEGIRPTVEVSPRNDGSDFKDIIIHVQEMPTGSLMFGVGVNSDAGLTGSIVLNERNFDITRVPTSFDDFLSGHAFRGADEEFRIEAVPGTQLQRYVVSFREPSLLDSPYFLALSAYYYDRIYNEYTEERIGTHATIGRQLNKYWSINGTVRVEEVGVHNVPVDAPEDFQSVAGENFLVGFRAGVTRDSRDSYLRPTEGSIVDAGFEEVTGDFTFPVFNVDASKYWTVWQRADGSGRHVLAARSQLDIEADNAPVYERFYAGGFRSMRGFEFRGVGPDIDGFKVGGYFMFLNSLEYQVPIKANDNLYMVAFVDSGTVNQSYNLSEYRVSAGFGVRVTVPMLGPVPIALDFGFPIVKAPQDNTQVFSFWVGFFH